MGNDIRDNTIISLIHVISFEFCIICESYYLNTIRNLDLPILD